jgi:DNA-binding transcriptional LysR family regulator
MEGYSGTLVRWLRSGMVDFALVDRFFADPELMLEPIVEDRMAVVVACGSDMLAPGTVGLRQLAGLPLVLPSARHGLRTLLTQSLSRHGLALQPRIEIDSMAGCLNMVKIGRYATILPMGSVYKSSNRRGVSVHEIRDPQIVRTICLARDRNKPGREAEADFLEALRLAFAGPVDHPPARLAMPASALVEIPLAS